MARTSWRERQPAARVKKTFDLQNAFAADLLRPLRRVGRTTPTAAQHSAACGCDVSMGETAITPVPIIRRWRSSRAAVLVFGVSRATDAGHEAELDDVKRGWTVWHARRTS